MQTEKEKNQFHYRGACHCGNISFTLKSCLAMTEISPRECDCDFCRKHGCCFVSDPEGAVEIFIQNIENIQKYRQGSKLADALICKTCGVTTGIFYNTDPGHYAALNSRCFDNYLEFAKEIPVSPKQLTEEEKIERWTSLWIPEVEIIILNK